MQVHAFSELPGSRRAPYGAALLLLAFLLLPAGAFAEALLSSPGWTLTKVQSENDDNSYDSRVFYSLKPPDGRQPIMIDSVAAARLRAGEAYAEVVYNGGRPANSQGSKEEEYVYGAHNSHVVVAEPVTSTLTRDDGRTEPAPSVSRPSTISGASSGGGSGLASAMGGSAFGSRSSSSGASRMPSSEGRQEAPAASSQQQASSGASSSEQPAVVTQPTPVVDPARELRAEELARYEAAKEAAKPSKPAEGADGPVSGISIAQGSSSSESGSGNNQKAFSVWPEGNPDHPDNKPDAPTCKENKAHDLSSPGISRISVPSHCKNVRIRAWGAGGGDGHVDNRGDGHGGLGGGGAYVYMIAKVDPKKHDLVIVVGGPGANGFKARGGQGGSPGNGGRGGDSARAPGGGGGGFSGVFYVERGKGDSDDKPVDLAQAIAIAAGGGGGGGFKEDGQGGVGGAEKGGGTGGGTQKRGGTALGNGHDGTILVGGEGGAGTSHHYLGYGGGGGGGGGFYGGAGGNGTANANLTAQGGSGGSSYVRYFDDFKVMQGHGSKGGNTNFAPRGKSGDNGYPGRVILEFY